MILLAILIAALALRIAVSDYSLWYDEIASLFFAHQPTSLLWSSWMVRETNPPLYYSLLHMWIACFGERWMTVRLLSSLIGVAGIAAMFVAGRTIGGSKTGLIAAALLAVSALDLDLSESVRGYGLSFLGVSIAICGLLAYMVDRKARALVVYAFGAIVAIYSHTTSILFVLLANMAVIVQLWIDRQDLRNWLVANAVIGLLWSWWAYISVRQAIAPHPNYGWIDRPSIGAAVSMTEQVYLPAYLPAGGMFALLELIALLALVLVVAIRTSNAGVRILATLCLGAPVALFLVSQHIPIFLPRTLLWADVPLLLTVAYMVGRQSGFARFATAIALIGIFAGGAAAWLPSREVEHWPQAMTAIARLSASEPVVVSSDSMAIVADSYRARFAPRLRIVVLRGRYNPFDRWGEGMFTGPHLSPDEALSFIKQNGSMVVIQRDDLDPAAAIASHTRRTPVPGAPVGYLPTTSLLTPLQSE